MHHRLDSRHLFSTSSPHTHLVPNLVFVTSDNPLLRRHIVHIACGSEHSIAVDSRGSAWTWGAEGRACLGHGEAGFGAPGGGTAVEAEAQARAMGLTGDGGGYVRVLT